MTTDTDPRTAQARLRLFFWAAAGGLVAAVVLAVVCGVLAFRVHQVAAERDGAYAHSDALEADAHRARVRTGDLDVKLAAADVRIGLLSEQVAQLKAELNAKEQAFAGTAPARASAASPGPEKSQGTPVPVQIAFNRAANGNLAGVFTNVSGQHVSLILEVASATNVKQARFTLELPAGARREIGPADGWQFARGDRVSASSKGFATVNLEVR